MKLELLSRSRKQAANALLLALVMLGVSVLMAAGIYAYNSQNSRLNQRNNDYYCAVAAAEAATEKVLSQATSDFHDFGDTYVKQRLSYYQQDIPTSSEASEWTNIVFMDSSGTAGQIGVTFTPSSGFVSLNGQYGPLRGFQDTMRIAANARLKNSKDSVVGAVYQDIQLTRIPIFQYAVFFNVLLEFTPLPPMVVTGPVHCNTNIYMNPAGTLTFMSDVTCSGTIIAGPNPLGLPLLGGSVTYNGRHDSGVSTLNLPIGTNNSPAAVQQVLNIPPPLEDPYSNIGQQRYYNKADLILMVSNTSVIAVSGLWNNFATVLSSNEVATFVTTNTSFYSKREQKTIQAINVDVGKLVQWNATNTSIRPILPIQDVRVLYVADCRTLASGNESGVRLIDGQQLPPQGLTVATASPIYVQGNYNCPTSALGTTNTSGSLPASVAADAVTVLSTAWSDANGSKTMAYRVAGNTTMNAAILTGLVPTTSASDSGGVENFPRFLEDWTGINFTYNGSMVCMFNSQIATGLWLGIGSMGYDIYNPPNRNWSWDMNYQYSNKLPPATPALEVLVRSKWRTPAAFTTNTFAGF